MTISCVLAFFAIAGSATFGQSTQVTEDPARERLLWQVRANGWVLFVTARSSLVARPTDHPVAESHGRVGASKRITYYTLHRQSEVDEDLPQPLWQTSVTEGLPRDRTAWPLIPLQAAVLSKSGEPASAILMLYRRDQTVRAVVVREQLRKIGGEGLASWRDSHDVILFAAMDSGAIGFVDNVNWFPEPDGGGRVSITRRGGEPFTLPPVVWQLQVTGDKITWIKE